MSHDPELTGAGAAVVGVDAAGGGGGGGAADPDDDPLDPDGAAGAGLEERDVGLCPFSTYLVLTMTSWGGAVTGVKRRTTSPPSGGAGTAG